MLVVEDVLVDAEVVVGADVLVVERLVDEVGEEAVDDEPPAGTLPEQPPMVRSPAMRAVTRMILRGRAPALMFMVVLACSWSPVASYRCVVVFSLPSHPDPA